MLPGHRLEVTAFEFKRVLGRGGFGTVRLAVGRKDGRQYGVKCMKQEVLIRTKQVDHILNEVMVMTKLHHPFVLKMAGRMKDAKSVYIVLEYISGGDLWNYLCKDKRFEEPRAKFYAAQIVCAIDHLHSKNVIHRDLKPENLLMCPNGYIKLCDFGLAKVLAPGERAFTVCGTPPYMAPEVIKNCGGGAALDWWALGNQIYEFIVGRPPYDDERGHEYIYRNINRGKVHFPKYFGKDARDLVKGLINHDLSKRLGNLRNKSEDVFGHAWFKSIAFDKLLGREIQAPFIPVIGKYHEHQSHDDMICSTDTDDDQGSGRHRHIPRRVASQKDPFADW